MPLVNMKAMLNKAREEGYAVGNFDVYNLEMLSGVMQAAEEKRSPVILAYAEAFAPLLSVEAFAAMAGHYAKNAAVPVALHLDHANNLQIIERALNAGFSSIMMDASDKALEENIAITQKVVAMCRDAQASAEAELGHVGGLEGQYEATDYDAAASYTNVEEAVQFVKETQVDALAVAIGTVHGVYKAEPKLNLERLNELKAVLNMPLVLHGGSGLGDDDLRACVRGGIAKLNIFTDLTIAATEQCRKDAQEKMAYMDKCMRVVEAVKAVAADRITVFGSAGKA